MFLLIQMAKRNRYNRERSLHSTMFLLIQYPSPFRFLILRTLHSTMFLLIPARLRSLFSAWRYFTFHNVSINTENMGESQSAEGPLHSTMFLLIQEDTTKEGMQKRLPLHSTMFLLIPRRLFIPTIQI